MPNAQLCELAVVLDRSGSMQSIKSDMEGGFARFMEEQRKLDLPCVVSLYQFDSEFEVVYEERPLDKASLELVPRGSTALLDAMGRSITLIGERLKRKPEHERPGKVVVLVITDGQENASREWKRDQVKAAVEHQREKYDWQFAFLGANIDAFAEAQSLGVPTRGAAKYQANTQGVSHAYNLASAGLSSYRRGYGAGGQSVETFDLQPSDDVNKDKQP